MGVLSLTARWWVADTCALPPSWLPHPLAVMFHTNTQVKVKEHVTDGLENAGCAFIEVRSHATTCARLLRWAVVDCWCTSWLQPAACADSSTGLGMRLSLVTPD
jgi:hypothetical protein